MRTIIRPGLFRCPSCGTYYNPTYGPCPNCSFRSHRSHPSYRSYLFPLILLTLLWLSLSKPSGIPLGAKPALAQIRPMPVQALFGTTFIDLNANGTKDFGEPAQPGILVEAHCTEQSGQLSSLYICWQSTNPLVIDGAGQVINIPLPAKHLYLPVVRK